MPKMAKEVEDKIVELIDQGYKDAEISRKIDVHRTTIANRRKAHEKRKRVQEQVETEKETPIQQEQPLVPKKYTQAYTDGVALSDGAMHRLYQIHALLGANSLEEMLETVYSDYVVVDNLWPEYEEFPSASKTFAFIIAEEKGYAADLKHDLDIYMDGYPEDQKTIAELKEAEQERFDEGYLNGKKDHALLVPCTGCGQPIALTPGTETHRLIVEFLRKHEIIHDVCAPRYQRIYGK